MSGSSHGPVVRRVAVRNRAGLHARPATMIAMKAKEFTAVVELVLVSVPADHHLEAGTRVDAKNSIELISLGAPQGTELDLEACGPDADAAIAALEALFAERFGLEEGE
jgi:phosphocarrier protein